MNRASPGGVNNRAGAGDDHQQEYEAIMDMLTAVSICCPLHSTGIPALPHDYYDAADVARERYIASRRVEIAADPEELAEALFKYMEQRPATVAMAIRNACSGTLVAAIELQAVVDKAVDNFIDWEMDSNVPIR